MFRVRTLALAAAAALLSAVTPATAAGAPQYVELTSPRPAWYTDALQQQVMTAGPSGVPLPEAALKDPRVVGMAFVGIRPGSWILSPAGCTANFVFQTNPGPFSTNQTLYIGTAGHCATQGRPVQMVAIGPGTSQPVIVYVGDVVVSRDFGVGDDFALIRIRTLYNSWVSPSMAVWGGPTGIYTSNAITPVVHTGHGIGIGTGGTPRAGLLTSSSTTARYWVGATIFGDSGSALNTATGLAVANITHLVVDTRRLPANSAGTRIEKILQTAGKPLSTCPTRTPWPLPGCPPV